MGKSTIGLGRMNALLIGWRYGDCLYGGPDRYERPREPVDYPAAVEIAERIRRSSLNPVFQIRRNDYIKVMGLECLTIAEGPPVETPPEWLSALREANPDVTDRYLFIWTKVLSSVLGSIVPMDFSDVLRDSWFFRREREWRLRQPPGALPRAVSVVLAPDEDAIAEYVEGAASCPDHWDALVWAVSMLLRCRQPLGDALGAWNVEALRGGCKRPDGRRAATTSRLLRDAAIVGAVGALERCGMKVRSDREPGPACDAVAEVFELQARTVLNIWTRAGVLRPDQSREWSGRDGGLSRP